MNTPVRTRFAPSPTGYMHIGGMRTALFAWLWARHTGGTFILRIDDTDQERNVEAALGPIFRAFEWLGLTWDEGPKVGGSFEPYYQSQRGHLYQAAVEKLLAAGRAYKDFDPPELIAEDRKEAEAAKRPYVTVRRSLELSDAERQQLEAAGKPFVVRFLIPRDQKIAIDDAVRGHVEWDCSLMPDPVIMRSNGTFLYNFATVVDDAQMQITHIIRAEEHLANTPVQALIHLALENPMPVFAHIPFITAPGSTKKLSKRDVEKLRNSPQLKKMFDRADEVFPQLGIGDSKTLNPVMVEYYEKLGYLPAGILNALSRLGWSLDGSTEFMSLSDVVQNFTLERIVKAPAGFDPEKLQSFQQHWMNQLSIDEKVAGCLPYLQQAKLIPAEIDEQTRTSVGRVITAIADRLRVFSDILDYKEFFISDDELTFDAKPFQQRIRDTAEAVGLLKALREQLVTAEPFDSVSLDKLVHDFVEAQGIKIGQIVHALRVAITGKSVGIGLFDAIAILGRERSLRRIDRALAHV
ncbi:glutamate--tRNA ligase [Schlesneria paludicola]|uniref:glutamate--tRNA ligase n=1 Tax=Schlesneria paludicola TaxID=360056 RepID=UPI00058C32E7|nr:glutamate--tRNA ligase [Schlesneria paludicola]